MEGDRYERGWDPQVKNNLRKIMSTASYGLLWMMFGVTAGLYFGLGYRTDIHPAFIIIFYVIMAIGLFFLIRFYIRLWSN